MKDKLKQQLQQLLAVELAAQPHCCYETLSINQTASFAIKTLSIAAKDNNIPATLLSPHSPRLGNPAVLYCHAHGNNYEIGRKELLEGRPALQTAPYGPLLAQLGFSVLCMDMPSFGQRQSLSTEAQLARKKIWQGQTLFGAMLADLTLGLDFLEQNLATPAIKIATMGVSMGATHAYWLAALDDRVSAVAHLCAFSNIKGLIECNSHLLHGDYLTIPGFSAQFDMADIAAAIAPRPQLVASGLLDPLTPNQALQPALQQLQLAYLSAPEQLTVINEVNSGHQETPKMREAVINFLLKNIG